MRTFLVALLVWIVAMEAFAQEPGKFLINAPVASTVWKTGDDGVISRIVQGTVAPDTKLRIELLSGDPAALNLVATIAEAAPADRARVNGTVPTDLPAGTYAVRLTPSDGGNPNY